jgi:polar amino acid transport system permease protein
MGIVSTFFNVDVLTSTYQLLLSGLWVTIRLGLVSIIAGLVFGLILALIRIYAIWPVTFLARIYIDIFRSLPLLVLLVVVYYALPFVGVRMSSFWSAMTALSLVSAAYNAEVYRAGIEAIPKGQFEASEALGLSYRHTMVDVILPQAIRIVIPPLTNNSINVVKDTALASVVALPDLLKQATQAQAVAANPSPLILAAIIYIILLWPLVAAVSRLERRFGQRGR